jgi:predicted ATPase
MGFSDRAHEYCQTALDMAQKLAHPMVSWYAEYYAAYFYSYTGELQKAKESIDSGLAISVEQDLAHLSLYSQALLGWFQARTGDKAGLDRLAQGVDRQRRIGDRMNLLALLRLQADACITHLLFPEALDIVNEALVLTRETQIVYEKAELVRLKGEILQVQSPENHAKARDYFLAAIESARLHNSLMWELRAEMSLARLSQTEGANEETHRSLKSIYDKFTESFESADLIQARDILNHLD